MFHFHYVALSPLNIYVPKNAESLNFGVAFDLSREVCIVAFRPLPSDVLLTVSLSLTVLLDVLTVLLDVLPF